MSDNSVSPKWKNVGDYLFSHYNQKVIYSITKNAQEVVMNLTDQFLDSLEAIAAKPIPQNVIERAKRAMLDYLCVTIAGAQSHRDKLAAYCEFAAPESGDYTIIGCNRKASLKEAVFLNGLNGHALDYDDGTNAGIIHLGTPLFSVLLPLAQKHGCSFQKLMHAVIIGYETSFTMALSIQPMHKAMGYHATGTCGTLGIAIAVSYLLDFTPQQRKESFAAACVSASGMLNVLDDGSELKPYNAGKAAVSGITAVQMAMAGFHGHPDPLGNERGFLKMMTGNSDLPLKQPLHEGTYAIEKAYTKPYAACRYLHPAIEAAVFMRNNYSLSPEDIKSIDIRTYLWAVNKHDHCEVPSTASAKMSIPYSVAVAIVYGRAGLREYSEENIINPIILETAKKVSVADDAELTIIFPEITSAIVKIITSDGRELVHRVDHPKGEPENPLTDEEFRDRFNELVLFGGKNPDDAEKIFEFVQNGCSDWNELFALLD